MRTELTLSWGQHGGREALNISGWSVAEIDELQGPDAGAVRRRLALLTSEALAAGGDPWALPPVAGRFQVDGNCLYFIPRFPFVAGMAYSLAIRCPEAAGDERGLTVLEIERPAGQAVPTATVVAIYPQVDEVPVNLLKFYVHFSEPMSEGRAQRAIRVCRDDTGEPIDGVFVPMDPELWDGARQRLTLLLDPARIKHGLVPNMEVGYPLIEGVPFRLFIDPDFRDARGRPLRAGAQRRYQVGPEVEARIDPGKWVLTAPAAGSKESLVVDFERPLDHALLQRCLWVEGPDRDPVDGVATAGKGEASWRFEPRSPWAEGAHRLVVERQLEDLAGNSPVRVFDRDMMEDTGEPSPEGPLVVEFRCMGG